MILLILHQKKRFLKNLLAERVLHHAVLVITISTNLIVSAWFLSKSLKEINCQLLHSFSWVCSYRCRSGNWGTFDSACNQWNWNCRNKNFKMLQLHLAN
jgi:hypothetical protein